MKIVTLVARLLLGLVFLAAGVSTFFILNHPPAAPGPLAAEFQHAFFASRWVVFTSVVQIVCGVLLLVNRYVPLALVALIGILYNIIAFHLTMNPSGIIPGLVCIVLWIVVARSHRANLLPLLEASPRRSA